MKRIIALLIFVVTLGLSLIFNADILTKDINKGIEFDGGIELLLDVEDEYGSGTPLADVAEIIGLRIDSAGVKNPQIDVESSDSGERIRVTLAGVTSDRQIREMTELVTSQGVMSFMDVNDNLLAYGTELISSASLAYQNGQPVVSLKVKDNDKFASITRNIAAKDEGQNLLNIWIDYDSSTDSFAKWQSISGNCSYPHKLTEAEEKLCGKVISSATVAQELTGDVIISGNFSSDDARQLASFINAGSIEYKLTVAQTAIVSGAYGDTAFNKAVTASVIALISVMLFMLIIYGLGGLIGALIMAVYAFAVIATFNWLGGEYGPDTIAALVIGFGMAIDATIIMLERFKDELHKGRKIERSFDEANKKSLSSILDANITTFIAAFVLFQFGTRTVKGFAIMLTISIFWTILVIVLVTRVLLGLLVKSGFFENRKNLFGVRRKNIPENDKNGPKYKGLWNKFNFIKPARKFIIASAIIIGTGLIVVFGFGTNNAIEFDGGTRYDITTTLSQDEFNNTYKDDIESIIEENAGIEINEITIGLNEDDYVIISYKSKDFPEDSNLINDKITDALHSTYNSDYSLATSQISPAVAKDTVNNAFRSLLFASLGIVIYVTIRFKWTYAISAIIALVHDVLIVYALFAIFRLEISLPFVSAVLAIIGYSINDTIVSFDRIRESVKANGKVKLSKDELKHAANTAIRHTATRSILTTVTTLIAVVSLLVFGPSASFTFNISMLFGLIAGTYSSIFIAAQVWIQLEAFRMKRIKIKKVERKPIEGEPDEHVFIGIND